MKKTDNILSELLELGSSLPSTVTNTNVFSVPEYYFEGLPSTILLKINTSEQPLEVPINYFENLSDEILNKIRSSPQSSSEEINKEVQGLSPVLAALNKTNCYSVPDGYFNDLPTEIMDAISGEKKAKVVTMRKMPAMVRYLIAAAFTGLIGFSIFSMFNNSTVDKNTAILNSPAMAEASKIIANDSFDAQLSTLTATDIENYLQQAGHDPDAAVAASAINDKNLPDELDYLINENTLNNFLNKSIAN